MNIQTFPLKDIRPYARNPRKNDEAVKGVAASIREFGFLVPLVIDRNHEIVCGHTRYKAAQSLGIKEVPCVVADELTEDQIKARSGWPTTRLARWRNGTWICCRWNCRGSCCP